MRLKLVSENRENYMPFLLLADEEGMIRKYLYEGEMFAIMLEDQTVGVVLFLPENSQVVELKNIALAPEYRGKGYGKAVITESIKLLRKKGYHKVIVGTANSSIENLAFYQKAGFRIYGIKQDFFLQYPEPIYENGIQAVDMVMFEMKIGN
ncbi:GNAT family N-acetyltransferase [Sutcliffiella rhizosphaerae]|uniref:N-acetyltransferase YvbK n=1 Tax=Sutcliffiella rhizosphaerae TaxID=2880967 RepID=A0ABN8A5V5_9BACI|nr:GNAT family N-acetyltransferase [Sutcliffiella rhizosphaerae]CAG9620445.1 putative N-acetyltransferase YvbK [Sutcliffiella rhizosphaerae]